MSSHTYDARDHWLIIMSGASRRHAEYSPETPVFKTQKTSGTFRYLWGERAAQASSARRTALMSASASRLAAA